jgi:hypothetical protein
MGAVRRLPARRSGAEAPSAAILLGMSLSSGEVLRVRRLLQ